MKIGPWNLVSDECKSKICIIITRTLLNYRFSKLEISNSDDHRSDSVGGIILNVIGVKM